MCALLVRFLCGMSRTSKFSCFPIYVGGFSRQWMIYSLIHGTLFDMNWKRSLRVCYCLSRLIHNCNKAQVETEELLIFMTFIL